MSAEEDRTAAIAHVAALEARIKQLEAENVSLKGISPAAAAVPVSIMPDYPITVVAKPKRVVVSLAAHAAHAAHAVKHHTSPPPPPRIIIIV